MENTQELHRMQHDIATLRSSRCPFCRVLDCAEGLQKRFGNSKKYDERQSEKPRTASTVAELMLQVFDDKLIVSHVCDQSNKGDGVHDGRVLVINVEGEKTVDKEIGGVNSPFVTVRYTADDVRLFQTIC